MNPRRHKFPWDSEEDAELLRLDSLGVSSTEIGLKLGRCTDSVKNRRAKLKTGCYGSASSRMILSPWHWIGSEVMARTLTGV